MTTEPSQNAIKVQVPEGFNLCVEFAGAGGESSIKEQPSNGQPTQSLAQRVLNVGDRLRDGTVVLSVDLDNNKALFVPAKIFGGKAKSKNNDKVVESANKKALHGHKDWRPITDDEGETLAKNWTKVTAQTPEWFWIATSNFGGSRRVRCGGVADWYYGLSIETRPNPVPIVRSGPARVSVEELAPA